MKYQDTVDEVLEWASLKQNVEAILGLEREKEEIDSYISLVKKGSISIKMSQEVRLRLTKLIKEKI